MDVNAVARTILISCVVVASGCKSRSWTNADAGSGLQSAGSGPSETDSALTELELIDCSEAKDGLCGSGIGEGVALVNPAQTDLLTAYSRRGLKHDLNPYDFGRGGSNGGVVYALTGKSAEIAASSVGAQLDQVAGIWNAFATTAGPMHKTPSVAAAVEVLLRGVVGDEIVDNPALLIQTVSCQRWSSCHPYSISSTLG